MKPQNFPARKLARKARAEGWQPTRAQLAEARNKRTKKLGGRYERLRRAGRLP